MAASPLPRREPLPRAAERLAEVLSDDATAVAARVEVDDDTPLGALLSRVPLGPRAAFFDLDAQRGLVGWGAAELLCIEERCSTDEVEAALVAQVRERGDVAGWLGGVRFDPARAPADEWRDFGAAWFLLPAVYVERDGSAQWLGIHAGAATGEVRAILRALTQPATASDDADQPRSPVVENSSTPDEAGYRAAVETATSEMRTAGLEKVVLARRVAFEGGARDALAALGDLADAEQTGVLFSLEPRVGHGFSGVSPERLYRRSGTHFDVDVLAGTRPRGDNHAEDERLRDELLSSSKDRAEHECVRTFVSRALSEVVREVKAAREPGVRALARVQHLHTPMAGELQEATPLLARLHPTPAVCGAPREHARAVIARAEPQDRGLYAGAVGWVRPGEEDFVVALRCARFDDHRIDVFTGAGLVPGSVPADEWLEVERKADGWRAALGVRT